MNLLKHLLLFCGLTAFYLFVTLPPRAQHEEARAIPVRHEGRVKPLDTVARVNLLLFHGKQLLRDDSKTLLPIDWIIEALEDPTASANRPLFRIDHPELQAFLNKTPEERPFFSYKRLSPHLKTLQERAALLAKKEKSQLDSFQSSLLRLTSQIQRYVAMEQSFQLLSPTDATLSKKMKIEVFYNSVQPFFLAIFFYLLAFFAAICSWMVLPHILSRLSLSLLSMGFLIHTLGILVRMYLEGRPPVTNLYSSALFVGWMSVLLGMILEKAFRNTFGTLVASLIGSLTLIISHHLAEGGDTLQAMQAVLNSNFWLSTHVVAITCGYSATFIAGFLGCFYVLYKLLCRRPSPSTEASLGKMAYGVICFATLFSFIGTVLGGIWADQSWGRFWGWDPKENGALMIVLWNALILHVRWGGLLQTHGIMLLAIGGNIVTSFSWFGVNMLGVGLHSYGFMESAFFWLLLFMASQLLLIALGIYRSLRQPQSSNSI